MEDQHHLKQVIRRLEIEIENKQEELTDVMDMLLPVGRWIDVKRGKGYWRLRVLDICGGNQCGYFKAISVNGKSHTCHYTEVKL